MMASDGRQTNGGLHHGWSAYTDTPRNRPGDNRQANENPELIGSGVGFYGCLPILTGTPTGIQFIWASPIVMMPLQLLNQ